MIPRLKQLLHIVLTIVVSAAGPTVVLAQAPVDYARNVKPIFKARCYACHGALKQESGLRLDTGALIRKGGDGGNAVVAGNPGESPLLERVAAKDDAVRMPPEGEPLTAAEINTLRTWISRGAASPADEQLEADPRDHWSFRSPVRPTPPQFEAAGSANPIDAFIARKQKEQGLAPQPPASKPIQLRRVYLDLIGLPPTRNELNAFLTDESPDAYPRVVDRLLDSPQYGERWGRHWMDVWRYSDWYGRRYVPDVWNSAPQVWRWRDWIVRSLNHDHGYDRMVREMLAADEIRPEDARAADATGYLVRNWYALNPNDWMRNTVEHTGKAFLGLTFNCAHCHDHKYDPIAQDDYFRLRAFFEPMNVRQDRVPGEADPGPFQEYEYSTLRKVQRLGAVRVFDKTPDAPTWFYTGGDERNRVKERGSIPPGVPAFLELPSQPEITTVELPPRAWYPGLQPGIQETVLADARRAIDAAVAELVAVRKTDADVPPAARDQLAMAEAAYASAVEAAKTSGRWAALNGKQSLVFDASQGRRIIQNRLADLKQLEDGFVVEFQLKIVVDAHFNFQFAKDVVKGLTAGYVGFEKGRIVSYEPGGFSEFEVGRYDVANGQNRFQVKLVLETEADRCLLTVRSISDDVVLTDAVPVALNGWNPVGDPLKAITFDARTGSTAVVDDVTLTAPNSKTVATATSAPATVVRFDFEPPVYPDGRDVAGRKGWEASSLCVAPATSVVSNTLTDPKLTELRNQLEIARRAACAPVLKLQAAEAQERATRAKLAAVEARIAADRAKHGGTPDAETHETSRIASRLERDAALQIHVADSLTHEHALAAAESLPAGDANRPKAITTAQTQLATTKAAVTKAKTAAADETSEQYTPFSPIYPKTSTGRRRALAEWITDRQNPLTARVAVNHIWMRHFHAPLVSSVYDFGRNGAAPTHPELLDWLAVDFMESGWSMKHLHRLIVTSAAYRRSSAVGKASRPLEFDPENKLLWRMNAGRMESEVVRDSLLYVSGRLDLKPGGQELENSEALTTFRRSLYYGTYPEQGGMSELGALFDAPDALECYRRTRSIVPQQALALTNSDLVHESSKAIVSDWSASAAESGEEQFVAAMFEQILSRTPTEAERQICLDAMKSHRELIGTADIEKSEKLARESLVRALLNHNDFVTIR